MMNELDSRLVAYVNKAVIDFIYGRPALCEFIVFAFVVAEQLNRFAGFGVGFVR